MTHKSIKHLITLAMFTTIALVIFVIEAQIPIPIPISGIKLGLANVITLLVLVKYSAKDALIVLFMRIFLGTLFTGQIVSFLYSISGGLLCFIGMLLLIHLLNKKNLWFVSIIGALLHNIGQTIAAIIVMQSVQVVYYLPFLALSGCISGLFTGLVAESIVKHEKKANNNSKK